MYLYLQLQSVVTNRRINDKLQSPHAGDTTPMTTWSKGQRKREASKSKQGEQEEEGLKCGACLKCQMQEKRNFTNLTLQGWF